MSVQDDLDPRLLYFLEFLSLTVVVITFVYKLPQLYTILSTGSTRCISLPSTVLETVAYSIMLTYNFAMGYPIFTYMEHFIGTLQDIILTLLIMSYRDQLKLNVLPYAVVYGICFAAVAMYWLPESFMELIMLSTTPLLVKSKIDQLWTLCAEKDPGQVSAITWGIIVYDTGVRIVTTALITGDMLYLLNLVTSEVFNVAIVAAILYYRHVYVAPSVSQRGNSQAQAQDALGGRGEATPTQALGGHRKQRSTLTSRGEVTSGRAR